MPAVPITHPDTGQELGQLEPPTLAPGSIAAAAWSRPADELAGRDETDRFKRDYVRVAIESGGMTVRALDGGDVIPLEVILRPDYPAVLIDAFFEAAGGGAPDVQRPRIGPGDNQDAFRHRYSRWLVAEARRIARHFGTRPAAASASGPRARTPRGRRVVAVASRRGPRSSDDPPDPSSPRLARASRGYLRRAFSALGGCGSARPSTKEDI
jgi:hypothetical protein